jgi:hypothetical protein
VIGRGELISEKYACMQRILHAQPEGYGTRGNKWAETVVKLIESYGATSVLDYGCGQGTLRTAVMSEPRPGVRFDEYDPGIQTKAALPSFADLVVCTDVLEHIEPERLDAVLAHLKLLARKAVFVVVALIPSAKILADGRNAHLIIRPANWWRKRCIAAGFTLVRPPVGTRKKKSHEWTAVLEP